MGRAADNLGRVGRKFRTLPEEGVQFATEHLRRALDRALVDAFGADRKLSGLRNGKAQRIKVTRRSLGHIAEGRVMAGPPDQRAPLFWREEGTQPHAVRGRNRSGRGNVGLHPGTPATYWWSRTTPPSTAAALAEFERLRQRALNG